MMPIGPAPVISTSSPTRSKDSAVWTALPSGIEDRADLVVDRVGQGHHVEGGQAQVLREGARFVHADAARLGVEVELARPALAAESCRSGALRPNSAGRSSGLRRCGPISTISPANSWPVTRGTGTVRCAQSSQFQMWMSVPQMPVLLMRISTSSGPISGTGRVSIQRPGSGFDLTSAFILVGHASTPVALPAAREGVEREVEIVAASAAAFICVRMRAGPLGTTGKKNARDMDAARRTGRAAMACASLRVAQHDRNDGVLAGQKGEARRRSALRANSRHWRTSCARRSSAASTMSSAARAAADDGRGQGVGEEVGPRALAQQVDHRLRPGDIAAQGAAKRLAQRAGQDVDLDARTRRACRAPAAP